MVIRFLPVVQFLVLGILLSPVSLPCSSPDLCDPHGSGSAPCEEHHDDHEQQDSSCGCPCHTSFTGILSAVPAPVGGSPEPDFPEMDERLATRFIEPDRPPPRA